ncbi:MAG TPA: adenine deaminase [Spirochaetota bacterium]|nr:adenine deaminase [Spirochaetota bacterium]HPR46392.1 adenine deaminase [Spirochaetota bacterium]
MKRLYLFGGTVIDVAKKIIYPADVLVQDGIITGVLHPGETLPGDCSVLDVTGRYIAPGFIDAHIHIESSMLPPLEFARAAVPGGTTTVLVDPHEITNVFGPRAVEFFMEQADLVPMDMYVGIPSCVPATHLESSGAEITIDDIRRFMADRRIYGLAEMMDFPDIIRGDPAVRQKVDAVYDYGKIVDGHCPGLSGDDLAAYISNGRNDGRVRIMNDHEATGPDEALEKLNAGMFLAIRYGSAEKNLNAILPGLIREGADLSRCMLCSDDVSAAELSRDGHVDRIIRRARDIFIETAGLAPRDAAIAAIGMATINPARYLQRFFDFHDMPPAGQVAAGCRANLVVLASLEKIEVHSVIRDGAIVAEKGALISDIAHYDYSPMLKSVNVGREITAGDFRIPAPREQGPVAARVIQAIPHSLLTGSAEMTMQAAGGEVTADPSRDIAKIAVFERHHARGSRTVALVKGLGIRSHAIASTVAHDSHNLIVAGVDDQSMARAARYLAEKGGGMVVVLDDGEVYLPLQIGGLMSTGTIGEVASRYEEVVRASQKIGMQHENIFMTLSFISLPVIPELKITDRGLVDVGKFDFVPLFLS